MTGGLDPAELAKFREAGLAALAELDAAHQVISDIQGVLDDKWREAYSIEGRIKAILVRLGLMSTADRFDKNTASLALRPGPGEQLDRAADIIARLTEPGPAGQASRDTATLLREQAQKIRAAGPAAHQGGNG